MKKYLICLAVAFLAAGCDNNDGGGSPTDPSQVTVQFSTTDLAVGTGAEAVSGRTATLLFELWLYNPAGTASKGTRIQGSTDAVPQAPGTQVGPVTYVVGTRQLVPGPGQIITGFDQGVVGMRVGGKRRMYIPPNLAYGSSGQGPIPPNASIVFEVELTNVQ